MVTRNSGFVRHGVLMVNLAFIMVRNDLAQPCRELCLCCCHPGMCADCHLPGTLCMWSDCTTCFEGCASTAGECGCLGGAAEAGLPLLFIMALVVLGLFIVISIFYSVLVATMVGQRIWHLGVVALNGKV